MLAAKKSPRRPAVVRSQGVHLTVVSVQTPTLPFADLVVAERVIRHRLIGVLQADANIVVARLKADSRLHGEAGEFVIPRVLRVDAQRSVRRSN